MNKSKSFFILITLFFSFFSLNSYANEEIQTGDLNTAQVKANVYKDVRDINNRDFYIFVSKQFENTVPSSYKYIDLLYTDIGSDIDLKNALQILVFSDILENKPVQLYPLHKIKASDFYNFIESKLQVNVLPDDETLDYIRSRYAKQYDLTQVGNKIQEIKAKEYASQTTFTTVDVKQLIFDDVYNTILNDYYNREEVDKEKVYNSAIKGLTSGTDDKYTIYMPAKETRDFEMNLNSEVEGIGAYVEMNEPGVMIITSPIAGSPAEKAGLQSGDQIIQIGDTVLIEEISLEEAVSLIKGKQGTTVDLKIIREDKILDFTITREKLSLEEVTSSYINPNTYIITITNFGNRVDDDFVKSLSKVGTDSNIKNIVFDLRNNPGGYLDKVTEILSYFIPRGEILTTLKYKDYEEQYLSKGYESIDLNNYNIYILQNGGTASASEIMIGVLIDYFPDRITVLGKESYGKGSVQTIKTYVDGSSLKYTIAKWYTGKSQVCIDGSGIKPDYYTINEDGDSTMSKLNELLK